MNGSPPPTEPNQIAEIVRRLTEKQRGWLETIADQPTGLLNRLVIPAGEGGGINGLIKKGLIEWRNGQRGFLQTTSLGDAVQSALREAASKAREARS